jgi:hypothetical protein
VIVAELSQKLVTGEVTQTAILRIFYTYDRNSSGGREVTSHTSRETVQRKIFWNLELLF